MFRIFKKKIPLSTIASNIVDKVSIIKKGIDQSAIDGGFSKNNKFVEECYALSYVLGIRLIQETNFSDGDRQRLSTGFTSRWSELLSLRIGRGDATHFLQNKHLEYESLVNDCRDSHVAMTLYYYHMINEIGENADKHSDICIGMGKGFLMMLTRMIEELNQIGSQYALDRSVQHKPEEVKKSRVRKTSQQVVEKEVGSSLPEKNLKSRIPKFDKYGRLFKRDSGKSVNCYLIYRDKFGSSTYNEYEVQEALKGTVLLNEDNKPFFLYKSGFYPLHSKNDFLALVQHIKSKQLSFYIFEDGGLVDFEEKPLPSSVFIFLDERELVKPFKKELECIVLANSFKRARIEEKIRELKTGSYDRETHRMLQSKLDVLDDRRELYNLPVIKRFKGFFNSLGLDDLLYRDSKIELACKIMDILYGESTSDKLQMRERIEEKRKAHADAWYRLQQKGASSSFADPVDVILREVSEEMGEYMDL